MFEATFDNVKTIIDRTVNSEGRIPRMSDHKGCRVAVVILEESSMVDGSLTYTPAGSTQLGLSDVVGGDE